MINLVIDIGNTLTKVAVFSNRNISGVDIFDKFGPPELEKYLKDIKIDNVIISSVNKETGDLENVAKSHCKYFSFNTGLTTRVKSHYQTPQTLGLDRFAAIIGAEAILPGEDCLVIDAGSCITCDFIDKNKNYYGGSISPGITMRFQSVHTFTERLPLIEPDPGFTAVYGTDTRSSILAGIQYGIWSETLGFIQTYFLQYPDLHVILCGGDVKFFDTRLKNSIFAPAVKTEQHLVLIGLNEVIYQQND